MAISTCVWTPQYTELGVRVVAAMERENTLCRADRLLVIALREQ